MAACAPIVHVTVEGSYTNGLNVGDPLLDGVDLGPAASLGARDSIFADIDKAVADGAAVLTGGGRFEEDLAQRLLGEPLTLGVVRCSHYSRPEQGAASGLALCGVVILVDHARDRAGLRQTDRSR
jgi:hypothetical protein